MVSEQVVLKMENITKDYYGNRVLENVSFELKKGEILGLVGENGAGKSTLMNILFGMSVISETGGYQGKVIIDGKEVNFKNAFDALDAGIGMVHQEFSLIPGFTTIENIMLNRESLKYNFLVEVFGSRLKTLDRVDMKDRAEKAISALGVKIDPNMLVAEMPVGHKQFTEIARELDRKNMKILVLDEPTAVLTESEADILIQSLKRLSDMGIAIIFISHRLKEIIDVCDKILVLRDGKTVMQSPAKDTSIRQIAQWMVGRNIEEKKDEVKNEKKLGDTVLKVENLWVDMPGETVRDVSFEVREGEIFGIGGLAGQGKLGIPNGIMGLYEAGGRIEVFGKKLEMNAPEKALKAGMAFVAEDRRGVGLLLEEPIDWNISFTVMQTQNKYLKSFIGGLVKWRDDKKISELAKEYIKILDIKCVDEKQPVQELSGGNQQKICLAKAFAVNPKILFVSEPTRGIDIGAKKLVLDTLKQYNQKYGTTIIMTSSELEELRSICDNIAIVDEGKVAGILPATAATEDFGLLMAGKVDESKEKVSAQ
ncbi:MAG TPA: sugar ABC transporter ATP-binding protein [Petrotogaceae bacterium]|nr:sugar ABC transporter ATP-binding protein [Petrotogaceae bacterium]HQF33878.1 sugar ABC transporter ATP-binding protein [Petrotogaceae bacterium]HQH32258.1 sugar ABC transporter ATP-binding protein [Petrotogaceae bacterium]HQI78858.1 sugar ABC transporter ATP-binding protein [Petrotogaceae bacterium]